MTDDDSIDDLVRTARSRYQRRADRTFDFEAGLADVLARVTRDDIEAAFAPPESDSAKPRRGRGDSHQGQAPRTEQQGS